MKVHVNTSVLRQTKWHEYAVRFLFGGIITAAAGLVAKEYGPNVGGLFLAFPAIFPASATLIEKHEAQKKQRVGMNPGYRGRDAASLDAAGAAMGSVGLIVFAIVVWKLLASHATWEVLAGGTLGWWTVSVLIWRMSEFF